jgi:hypothetical protein
MYPSDAVTSGEIVVSMIDPTSATTSKRFGWDTFDTLGLGGWASGLARAMSMCQPGMNLRFWNGPSPTVLFFCCPHAMRVKRRMTSTNGLDRAAVMRVFDRR